MNSSHLKGSPARLPETATLADYQRLATIAADWVWVTDREHDFTHIAGSPEEITGVTSDEMIGTSRKDIFRTRAKDEPRFQAHLDLLDRHEPFRNFVYKFIDPRGGEHWISVDGSPVFDGNGEFQGYQGLGRNVSSLLDIIEDADRARSENRRLNSIVDASLDAISSGVVIYDERDRLVYANKAMREMYAEVAVHPRPRLPARGLSARRPAPQGLQVRRRNRGHRGATPQTPFLFQSRTLRDRRAVQRRALVQDRKPAAAMRVAGRNPHRRHRGKRARAGIEEGEGGGRTVLPRSSGGSGQHPDRRRRL